MPLRPWHRSLISTFIPVFRSTTATDTPAALVERAAALGYAALALTDTNGLYGAVPFCKAAKAAGIAPLLGARDRRRRPRWSARGRAGARAGGLSGALPDRDAAAPGVGGRAPPAADRVSCAGAEKERARKPTGLKAGTLAGTGATPGSPT